MWKRKYYNLIGVLLIAVLLVVCILKALKNASNEDLTDNGINIKYLEKALNEDDDFCDDESSAYYITFESYVNGKKVEFADNYVLACEKNKGEINPDNLISVTQITTDKKYYVLIIPEEGFNTDVPALPVVVNEKGEIILTPDRDTNTITLTGEISKKYPLGKNQYLIKDNKLYYYESDHCTYTNIIIADFKNDKVTKETIKLSSSDYTSSGEWC